MRLLYSLLLYCAVPIVVVRLLWRGRKAPAYWQRWGERFGFYRQRLNRSCIWVHAVSVGEVRAAMPMIKSLQVRYPHCSLVITTTTPTGSVQVQQEELQAQHFYAPYDLPGCVERFLDHVQPCVAIIMETELWPNLFNACQRHQVPVAIANARLSAHSARRYQWLSRLTRQTLQTVTLFAVQSAVEAKRFVCLGARPETVQVTGNIKFDISLPASLHEQATALRRDWGVSRPIWVAASTHEGEDELLLDAFAEVRRELPGVLLVLVPRHPERFAKVAGLAQARGYQTVLRSQQEPCSAETAVFVGDTMGELCLFYAAADIAFVGGSLVSTGGHNILEPAALGKAVIFGPYMFNFTAASQLLLSADAALQVSDVKSLAAAVITLCKDSPRRHGLAEKARQVVTDNRGALDRTVSQLSVIIDKHCSC